MKKTIINFGQWTFLFILFGTISTYAQQSYPLGTTRHFLNQLQEQSRVSQSKNKDKAILSLSTSDTSILEAKVNYRKDGATGATHLEGEMLGSQRGSFSLQIKENKLEGNIILPKSKKAYVYYSDTKGNAFVKETDINKLVCIDYNFMPEATKATKTKTTKNQNPTAKELTTSDVSNLQSMPGAKGCILLDFDGYNLAAGSGWNAGNPLNAAPSGMTNDAIQETWEVIAEDYRPFNINITTNEAVYNSYPQNKRKRCVFTTTSEWYPGANGVAFIGAFPNSNDIPCWVFNKTITDIGLGPKTIGDAASHEIGHLMSLLHDGTSTVGYYGGHGNWGPVMGATTKSVIQWSKGEYPDANNQQDDLAIISGAINDLGYRADDHGNSVTAATPLFQTNGTVSPSLNKGIIERTGDGDLFSFTTTGGSVSFTVNAVPRHSNLRLFAGIYNILGVALNYSYATTTNLSAPVVISANLLPGTYYILVSGVNDGTAATGYTNYASLGAYTISGTYPAIAPSITTACVGGSLQLATTILGTSYQWQYQSGGNWYNYPEGNNGYATFSGSKTASMTVSNISALYITNPNTVRAAVTQINGTTTYSTPQVWKAEGISAQPVDKSACVGGSLQLSAQASGASYQWQYLWNGNWYNYPEGNNGYAIFSGSKTPSMTVSNISALYVTNPNQARLLVTGTNGCTTASDTVTWKAINCSGKAVTEINETKEIKTIQSVYPNPVKDELTINTGSIGDKYQVEVITNLGQVLYTTVTSDKILKIPFSEKPAGTYLVTIKNIKNGSIKSFRVIKVK